MTCGLCELKIKIHTYDESDPRWIIIDCMTCKLPMSVWRGEPPHTMEISELDSQEMESHLRKIAVEKFGNENFYIDKFQREIPDHLHWHARPNGWKPPLKYRIKNIIRDFYRKCIPVKCYTRCIRPR